MMTKCHYVHVNTNRKSPGTPTHRMVLLLLLLFLTSFSIQKLPFGSQQNSSYDPAVSFAEFFYKYPDQPTASPNMTIAIVYDLVGENGTTAYYESVQNVMTMVCAIAKYNEGTGKFSPKGLFNALIMETSFIKALHAYTTVEQLLGQNLYYIANGSSFGAVKNTPINAIVRMATVKDLGSDVPTLASVLLPSINFASEALYYSRINYPLLALSRNYDQGSLLISQPSPGLISIYLLELARYFKWDLIGAIFSTDIIGFFGQISLQDILFRFKNGSGVSVPCVEVLDSSKLKSVFQSDLQDFASCIKGLDTVSVIIVWMESDDAINATEQFLSIIGTNKRFIFLYPGLVEGVKLAPNVEGSMFLAPNVNVSDSSEQFTCPNAAKEELIKVFGTETLDATTQFLGNCTVTNPDLKVCNSSLGDSLNDCTCSSDRIYYSPIAADSVNVLMKTLENMQTNCTQLNDCTKEFYPHFKADYCSKKTFDGADLYYASKCSPFYGDTGEVKFTNSSDLRQTYPMKVFQIQPDKKIVAVASFINGTFIVYDNLYFLSGKPPVSTVVVDDPSLDDGFVVAFFSINIILMVITLGLMIFVFVKRNNRIIRASGTIPNLLILFGLLLIEISVIFMCFDLTATICRLIDILMLIGVSFIISTLAAKLYRIYRIFQNPTAEAIHITDKDLFIFTCIITLGTILLFVLYETLGGGLQPVVKTASLNYLYTYNICEVPNMAIQITFLILFYVYFLLLFVTAGVLAFMTRKTMRDYNESVHVSSVVYSWIAVALIYAPIYYVQGSSTNSNQTRYAVRFIAIDLVVLLTLGILFWQKVRNVWKLDHAKNQ